jgi:copper homeostasis protein
MLLEACLDSLDLAVKAEEGGAGRIELCDRLDVGGTTPPASLIREVSRAVRIPVFVIVRPRGGDFVHSPSEVAAMKDQARMAVDSGAAGIVVGILNPDDSINVDATRSVMDVVAGTPATFHLAFDRIPDQLSALDTLAAMGVRRVLTSGAAGKAINGVDRLRDLVEYSNGRVIIMAGGSIREDNATDVVRRSGVTEIHSRGTAVRAIVDAAKRGALG